MNLWIQILLQFSTKESQSLSVSKGQFALTTGTHWLTFPLHFNQISIICEVAFRIFSKIFFMLVNVA